MTKLKNYYRILGITKNSTQEEIKGKFRTLAKQWHPDLNKTPEAHKAFLEIYEAYEILSDPLKRVVYDKLFDMEANSLSKKHSDYSENSERLEDWIKTAGVKAESLIKDGYAVLEKVMEAGALATKTGCNILSTIFGAIFLFGVMYSSYKTFYEVIILGKDVDIDVNPMTIFVWVIALLFTVLFFFNIYWFFKGEDSIFRKRPE